MVRCRRPGARLVVVHFTLWVSDNGRGFDVDEVLAASAGIGMSSMRARIERMGGQLRIESRPGHTLLTATIAGRPPAYSSAGTV
ncbi:hypothetical protein PSEUDO8Z_60152 [Pseudomonas sp. 8Z]|uniref:ATP-binding protein n=1 Tax=Pseudomonas sp. 8Z TaxID=2653166 RepID=UPI0012F3B07A|nr:ATP-binding protein [Pseudomonas sp. 8Z]VXC96320.1 hypothetical protein PSEUDO8Z_60152 [Pseudomonas sp. 8Z]